jgi:NADH-quinone oxidoreductase subunit N
MNIALQLNDFAALSPLLVILNGSILMLLLESFASHTTRSIAAWLTTLLLIIALLTNCYAPDGTHPMLTAWLRFDTLSRIFTSLFLTVGIAVACLSSSFFSRTQTTQGEYFFLLLAAIFGLQLVGSAADFLTLFLGIEILSLALYVLCAYIKESNISREGAVKYFLTGSLAAAILLYGIAFIYGATGTTRLDLLLTRYQALDTTTGYALFMCGIAFVTAGLAFKASIVPFHAWAPDVYSAAPPPITAFMAVGTKIGAFAALTRVFLEALPHFDPIWQQGMVLLAYPTLIYANFVAIRQPYLLRFFAYSGISHAGFLLLPLIAGGPEATPALLFYLVVYLISTLGAFATLVFLERQNQNLTLHDLQGFFSRSPFLASSLTLCLITLAGIPPTPGFFAKIYIFKVAYSAGFLSLIVLGLLTTILAAYYYLRLVAAMFTSAEQEESTNITDQWPVFIVSGIACIAIIALVLYPKPLLQLIAHF